jgi:acetyl esterase/lipase
MRTTGDSATVSFMIGLLIVLRVVAQAPSGHPKPRETGVSARGLMTVAQFQAIPSNPADHRFSYGTDANQFGELRLPSGAGQYPVAILIHGGCWKAEYATLRDLAPMADRLKEKSIATWNIEYRRLAQAGGGWPGTYLDVGEGSRLPALHCSAESSGSHSGDRRGPFGWRTSGHVGGGSFPPSQEQPRLRQ